METETIGSDTATEAQGSFDMDSASDAIGANLFPEQDTHTEEPGDISEPEPMVADATTPAPVPVEPVAAPKSWPKEMHEHWGTVPKPVQDYWQTREKQMLDGLEQYKQSAQYGKALSDVLAPYQPILQSKGLDAPRAVADLMQAYVAMTQGTPEQRATAYAQIGKNLGITLPAPGTEAPQADPQLRALQEQFQQMQSVLTSQQQATYQAAQSKALQEVEAFAADATHPHFEVLQDDILGFLKLGDTLQSAYEKAVWANPVTRTKELAKTQIEVETKLKENARLQALPKKQAKSVNIGGRDTQKAPTEPLGSMEDTIKSTLANIRSRVTH